MDEVIKIGAWEGERERERERERSFVMKCCYVAAIIMSRRRTKLCN